MTVYNDGFGNYFSGSINTVTPASSLVTDLRSMLTSLGVSYTESSNVISFRPSGDIISGEIGTRTVLGTSTSIPDQARFALQVDDRTILAVTTLFHLNSSSDNTEITIRGDSTGVSIANFHTNVFASGNAKTWGIATNKSLGYFAYNNANNYLFNMVGVCNNPGIYNFPESIFGVYSGRYQGTKVSSFRGVSLNSSTPVEFHRSGANANFTRLVSSGSAKEACLMLPRRVDNNYAIGTIPNLVTVTRSFVNAAGLVIGDYPVDLYNFTQSNNTIDGSNQDKFIYVGNLDSTAGDDNGDGLFMRIYNDG